MENVEGFIFTMYAFICLVIGSIIMARVNDVDAFNSLTEFKQAYRTMWASDPFNTASFSGLIGFLVFMLLGLLILLASSSIGAAIGIATSMSLATAIAYWLRK